MIPEAKFCKRHKKYHNPNEECPVCEAMKVLQNEKYESKAQLHINHKECEQTNVCRGGCQNKNCS